MTKLVDHALLAEFGISKSYSIKKKEPESSLVDTTNWKGWSDNPIDLDRPIDWKNLMMENEKVVNNDEYSTFNDEEQEKLKNDLI